MINKIKLRIFKAVISGALLWSWPYASAQSLGYTPPAQAAFLGSGSPTTWSAWTSGSGSGALGYQPPAIGLYCQANPPSGPWTPCNPSTGGGGTVTSFSSGNLSPLFTTSVATSTTTPTQSFAASTAAQNSVLAGPATGGAGVYSFQTSPTISAANMTNFPTLNQNTTGNAATASSVTFAGISSATNTTASMVVGSGSVLSASGSGILQANDLPLISAGVVGTNSTGAVVDNTALFTIFSGTGTFTTATSDNITVTGATSASICVFAPTNSTSTAAGVIAYISGVAANTVTITHAATLASGGTVNVLCH